MNESAIIIISHSKKISEGIYDMIKDFTPSVTVLSFGGLSDGRFGSNFRDIYNSVIQTNFKRYFCFYDLGSSKLNLTLLQRESGRNLIVFDAPLIEGSFKCAVGISINKDPIELEKELTSYEIIK